MNSYVSIKFRLFLPIEKVILPYCRKEVSALLSFIFERQRIWWRRGEDVHELGEPQEDRTL